MQLLHITRKKLTLTAGMGMYTNINKQGGPKLLSNPITHNGSIGNISILNSGLYIQVVANHIDSGMLRLTKKPRPSKIYVLSGRMITTSSSSCPWVCKDPISEVSQKRGCTVLPWFHYSILV